MDANDAREYISGFTVGNDVSTRDLQHGDGQWVRGKSLDTFAPIGPDLVSIADVDDPHDLDIWTEVNGERVQDSTTANLIFSVDELIASVAARSPSSREICSSPAPRPEWACIVTRRFCSTTATPSPSASRASAN